MTNTASDIIVVDYGMGNLGSIRNMLKKVGAECVVTSDPDVVAKASRIVLPGVGHFGRAMSNIAELGLKEVLDKKALVQRVPILGVCLGMQLMTESSDEAPDSPGFGWIPAQTRRFDNSRFPEPLRIPHIGWNVMEVAKKHPLFEDDGIEEHRFYFVHTYAVTCTFPEDVLGHTSHGHPFVAAFARDNLVGCQFHPEKSHKFGMSLFRRFVQLA